MELSTSTYNATIFIGGDFGRAIEICEEYCLKGCCVTCERTLYIYTMGREEGVKIGLINYPRFPKTKAQIKAISLELAEKLLIGLNQGSYSIQYPDETIFKSRRECDNQKDINLI